MVRQANIAAASHRLLVAPEDYKAFQEFLVVAGTAAASLRQEETEETLAFETTMDVPFQNVQLAKYQSNLAALMKLLQQKTGTKLE